MKTVRDSRRSRRQIAKVDEEAAKAMKEEEEKRAAEEAKKKAEEEAAAKKEADEKAKAEKDAEVKTDDADKKDDAKAEDAEQERRKARGRRQGCKLLEKKRRPGPASGFFCVQPLLLQSFRERRCFSQFAWLFKRSAEEN